MHHLDTIANDNNVIYGIQRILQNQNLYQNPNEPPYSIIQYTPLFYHLAAAFAHVFAISHDEVHQLFVLSRSLNLGLNLLTLLVLWQILRHLQFDFLQKTLSVAFVFSLLHIHYWARCDSLYLLFFVLTIYTSFVYFFEQKTAKTHLFLAFLVGALSGLAFFSKQNLPYPLLVFGLYAVFQKRFSGIFSAAFGFLVSLFVLYFCFTQNITWHIFAQNTVLGLNSYLRFPGFLYFPLTESLPLWAFLSSGFYFCFVFIKNKIGFSAQGIYLATALGTTAVLTFFTIFKAGSGSNYFNDFFIYWILAAFFYYNAVKPFFKGFFIKISPYAVFIFILLRSSSLFFNLKMANETLKLKDDTQLFENQRLTANYLKTKTENGVYIQTNGLSFFGNFLPKNALFPQRDIETSKNYDYHLYLNNGNSGLIRYLILAPKDVFPPTYLGLRLDNFRLDTVINGVYRVYEKK